MKKKISCKICGGKKNSKSIITRDKTKSTLIKCNSCDFAFLKGNPHENLSKNKLDHSRLNFRSLNQITIKKEYDNNYLQAKTEYQKYLDRKIIGKKILEVGPSWGAFLNQARKLKMQPFGVEIDKKKCDYINSKLKIKCFSNYNYFIKKNIKFKRIFLFYVIEYFYNPQIELKKLLRLLDKNGKIIIITPNYKDILKDVWKNKNYISFFYEKNAKNYFSIKSLKNLMIKIKVKQYKIFNKQGYGLLNSLNWLFNGSPIKSRYVGSDEMNQILENEIDKFFKIEKKKINQICRILKKADKIYKNICEKKLLGNQIHLEIRNN